MTRRYISGSKRDFPPDAIVVAECLHPGCAAGCADHLSNISLRREPTHLYGTKLLHKRCSDASEVMSLVVDTYASKQAA